jgi:uncharacterized protein YjeT (DUF2065 family)
MIAIYSFTLVFGLVVILFGISLALLPNFWRAFGRGTGEVSAFTNNLQMKMIGLSKVIKFKGADEKHMPSNKGMAITGVVFIVIGVLIILMPYIWS